MLQLQWLGEPVDDAFELKEQAKDAQAVACAAVDDAQRAMTLDVAGPAATTAETQADRARTAVQKVINIAKQNPGDAEIAAFTVEAQRAVADAEACAREARRIADSLQPTTTKKESQLGWWLAAAAILAALAYG